MILRETLKQEIDTLSESQLQKIAEMLASLKPQPQKSIKSIPIWQRATPLERVKDIRAWVAQLPRTKLSLSDEACDRGSIYE